MSSLLALLAVLSVHLATTNADTCPDAWIDGLDLGCLWFGTNNSSWLDASEFCEDRNSSLVEVFSSEENEILSLIATLELQWLDVDGWWLGLDDLSHEGTWEWQHSMRKANYFSWANESPDIVPGNRNDCVSMMPSNSQSSGFVWYDFNCEKRNAKNIAPLCQIRKDESDTTTTTLTPTTASPTTTHPNVCPESEDRWTWTPFNGYCYKPVDIKEYWDTAEEYCKQLQSHLVSVHSKWENDFLANLTKSNGMSDTHLGGFVIGPADSNNWKWSDDTSWDYSYWYPGYPSSHTNSCIYLWKSDFGYRWRNSDCRSSRAFVCKL